MSRFEVYWCDKCGDYESLGRDSCSTWDVRNQKWEEASIYDEAEVCNECGEEGTIQWGGYLPKMSLKKGTVYVAINERTGTKTHAMWDGELFHYPNQKFGRWFIDEQLHFDDDDRNGILKPLYEAPL